MITAVYAVVEQADGVTQNIVAAKSRLAKRGLTIPRLELVAAHMATNLIVNVQRALVQFVAAELHCWLDSTVALYWIKGTGEYKQFVTNRVNKIQQHTKIQWHHVPTGENPADLGSRGGSVVHNQYWRFGPEWSLNRDQWPPDITLEPSAASNAEAKTTREVLAVAIPRNDTFDELLNKHELWKVLRICSWIRRFFHNCRMPIKERNSGPLKSVEVERQKMWWIKRVQRDAQANQGLNEDRLRLNLQPNKENILECRGCIQGEYPTYLPDDHQYTKKPVH